MRNQFNNISMLIFYKFNSCINNFKPEISFIFSKQSDFGRFPAGAAIFSVSFSNVTKAYSPIYFFKIESAGFISAWLYINASGSLKTIAERFALLE